MRLRQTRAYGLFLAVASGVVAACMGSGCTDDAYCFVDCGDSSLTGGMAAGGAAGMGGQGGDGGNFIGPGSSGGGSNTCGADLLNDVNNCGACDNRCMLASAFPKCMSG